MIVSALLLAAAVQSKVLEIRVEGDGDKSACIASIDGVKFDPRDQAAVAKAFKPYPADEYLATFIADENISYKCIGAVIYQVQSTQYRFAKMGFVQTLPEQQ